MAAVKTEQVCRLVSKAVQVFRIKWNTEDAADTTSGIEKVWLVAVNEYVHIECTVPAALHIRSILPVTQHRVWSQWIVGHI